MKQAGTREQARRSRTRRRLFMKNRASYCRFSAFLSLMIPASLLIRCAATSPPAMDNEPPILELPPYSGAKKTALVLDFKNRTGFQNVSLGPGIASMVSTALIQSNRFKVVSRGEELESILKEQALSLTGAVDNTNEAVRIGQLTGAETILSGTVSEFGIRTYSATAGALVGFAGKKRITARVVIDAMLIDINTGEAVAAATGIGKSSSTTTAGAVMPLSIEVGAEGFDETTIGIATRKAVYRVVEKLCK